jgi:hypothetical protein
MPRTVKQATESRTRADYKYFAYTTKQRQQLERIVLESGGKYGLDDVNNLLKNLIGECIAHYEEAKDGYIQSRKHAVEHWQDGRFAPLGKSQDIDKFKAKQKHVYKMITQDMDREKERIAKLMQELEEEQEKVTA